MAAVNEEDISKITDDATTFRANINDLISALDIYLKDNKSKKTIDLQKTCKDLRGQIIECLETIRNANTLFLKTTKMSDVEKNVHTGGVSDLLSLATQSLNKCQETLQSAIKTVCEKEEKRDNRNFLWKASHGGGTDTALINILKKYDEKVQTNITLTRR